MVYILAYEQQHAQHIAHAIGLDGAQWRYVYDERDLVGRDGMYVLEGYTAYRRKDYRLLMDMLKARKAIVFTEHDYGRP